MLLNEKLIFQKSMRKRHQGRSVGCESVQLLLHQVRYLPSAHDVYLPPVCMRIFSSSHLVSAMDYRNGTERLREEAIVLPTGLGACLSSSPPVARRPAGECHFFLSSFEAWYRRSGGCLAARFDSLGTQASMVLHLNDNWLDTPYRFPHGRFLGIRAKHVWANSDDSLHPLAPQSAPGKKHSPQGREKSTALMWPRPPGWRTCRHVPWTWPRRPCRRHSRWSFS